ncbi:two-component regulator propeller domain-containing protein [Xanthomarina sp. GH4-25]|uniref:two-component regulator propeller domain-containing protein n=1 Tax=Xanthomarina sp. GH4-25 TaxID=3349335 RepID=UPI00387803DB
MRTKKLIKNKFFFLITLGVFLLTFLHPNNLFAQEIDANYITISDGMASPTVQAILQDSYGYIWFGTSNGLQKYDGINFENFKSIPGKTNSLPNNNVWVITEDDEHNFWIGTDAGISYFNRTNKTFTNYDFTKIFNLSSELSAVFSIFIDSQKNIWASSRGADLVRYDKEKDTWIRASFAIPNISGEANLKLSFNLSIVEDSKGGLWTGSMAYGLLYRAKNEEKFKPVVFKQNEKVDFTNEKNNVTALYFDHKDQLWITTLKGIYKYNSENNTLKTLQTYQDETLLMENYLNSIMQDHNGNIWITNNIHGMLKFEGISDQFQNILVSGVYKMKGLGFNVIFECMTIDKSGIFWIGSTTNGVLKYDPEKKPFLHYTHDQTNQKSMSMNGTFGLLASKVYPNIVYVGTRGKGLNIFNEKEQTFKEVRFNAVNDFYGGAVRSIGENPDGTLYIGTWGDGLIKLDKNYKETARYIYDPKSDKSISDNSIRVLKKDAKNNYWIGTNNGLNYFDINTNTFKRFSSVSSKAYPDELVQKIEAWSQRKKVIAKLLEVTDNQNLTQTFEITKTGTYLIASVGEGNVTSMSDFGLLQNAAKDTLWISNQFEKTNYAGGANKNRIEVKLIDLQPGTYELKYHSDDNHSFSDWNALPPDKTSLYGIVLVDLNDASDNALVESLLTQGTVDYTLSANNILSLALTDSDLWVGTDVGGLNRIDLKTNTTTTYRADANSENSLSSDLIYGIAIDQKGILWLATNAGLNKLDPKTGTVTRYGETDGLPTNLIEAVVIGKNDEFWVSTQNGLSQMVNNEALDKVTFINYSSDDGLGGDIFISQVATVTPEGRFYFGGEHGLNAVNKIKANDVPPNLVLSDLLISNQSIYNMEDVSPLKNNLMDTEDISLAFNQNNLSFEFVALHYTNPKKNQYAHMLKGYDTDWIYDNRNYASYTNLDPGSYEFLIRASNAYGVWSEKEKSIRITITPPWYKTWWAYSAYVLLFGLLFFVFDRIMRRRLILREREKSREKELAQAKEIEKAYTELKNTQSQLIQSEKMASLGELTAGIAHEIQNPLNFVNNFSEVNIELIDELQEELNAGNTEEAIEISNDIKDNEKKITHHGKRADSIVKGMLKHSRNTSGEREPTNINAIADEYLRLAYHGLRAKDKTFNATLNTDLDESIGNINVVGQDIGRVILNLITNALHAISTNTKDSKEKTIKNPTVWLSTQQIGDNIIIKVKDNGSGIPNRIIDKIFQPFFTTKASGQGTGLGLSMSYDIIKSHGGDLKVDSEIGIGTTFTITLPK